MKNSIDFVKKGLAPNSPVDIYKFISIKDGRVQTNNGIFAMSAPIAMNDEVVPVGVDFMKAMERCEETTTMSILASGKLKIKSGKFSANINCSTSIFPRIVPEGQSFDVSLNLGEELADLKAFSQEDNAHLWASGVLINGQSAKATNNIVVVEKWLSQALPFKANIPVPTVKCLIDLKLEVQKILVSGYRITFLFEGDKWLSTSLIQAEWFDTEAMLNVESVQAEIDPALKEAAANLKAKNTLLELKDISISDGTMTYELPSGNYSNQTFSGESLNAVLAVATTIDLSGTGNTSIFYGKALRGAITRRIT